VSPSSSRNHPPSSQGQWEEVKRGLIHWGMGRVLDTLKSKLDEAGWEDKVRDVARGASLSRVCPTHRADQ
jgi:hypothetical protein